MGGGGHTGRSPWRPPASEDVCRVCEKAWRCWGRRWPSPACRLPYSVLLSCFPFTPPPGPCALRCVTWVSTTQCFSQIHVGNPGVWEVNRLPRCVQAFSEPLPWSGHARRGSLCLGSGSRVGRAVGGVVRGRGGEAQLRVGGPRPALPVRRRRGLRERRPLSELDLHLLDMRSDRCSRGAAGIHWGSQRLASPSVHPRVCCPVWVRGWGPGAGG